MSGAPRRSLGQNFLVDSNHRRRIVEELGATAEDTVLEIGPGRGALTQGLAEVAGRLILVELDRALAERLRARFEGDDRVTVVEGDILRTRLDTLTPRVEDLLVVGNIPYNITTPILFHLLAPPRPKEILVMVQKEVAERILAEPGCREYGALSVGVRAVATVEQVLTVPPTAFRPRPRVTSSVIRIRPALPVPLSPDEETALRDLTRATFQWRRKQLRKILRDHPEIGMPAREVRELLAVAGAEPADRPETVPPEGFMEMARLVARRRAES